MKTHIKTFSRLSFNVQFEGVGKVEGVAHALVIHNCGNCWVQGLNEQVDCMNQKLETMATLYQALQTDYSAAMSDVKV